MIVRYNHNGIWTLNRQQGQTGGSHRVDTDALRDGQDGFLPRISRRFKDMVPDQESDSSEGVNSEQTEVQSTPRERDSPDGISVLLGRLAMFRVRLTHCVGLRDLTAPSQEGRERILLPLLLVAARR